MTQQLVFTKTRILTVKVATLVTFLSMVKTLDQVNVDVIARWQFG
jgi:SCY1-like protein 2